MWKGAGCRVNIPPPPAKGPKMSLDIPFNRTCERISSVCVALNCLPSNAIWYEPDL